MNVDDYPSYDGLGLAQLVHSGEVRAEELLEAAIAQNEPRLIVAWRRPWSASGDPNVSPLSAAPSD